MLDLTSRGSAHIDKEGHRDITLFLLAPDIDPVAALESGSLLSRPSHQGVHIQVFSVRLSGKAAKGRRP